MTSGCDRTTQLLHKMKDRNDQDPDYQDHIVLPAELLRPIATLAPGVTRPLSPMLQARFLFCGSWKDAYLDQNWLSLSEISAALDDPEVRESLALRRENWSRLPPESVKPEDCAIFSHNPFESEETYLVWEEGKAEPVVWNYFEADYYYFSNLNHFIEYIVGERRVDDSGRVTAEP